MSTTARLESPSAVSRSSRAAPSIASLVIRTLAVALLLFVCRMATFQAIAMPPMPQSAAASPLAQVLGLFAGCLIYAAVLGFVVVRSRLSGLRLALVVFWLVFGITVALAQVESAVFLQSLVSIISSEMLVVVVEQATLFSVLCAVLAPLAFGRLLSAGQQPPAEPATSLRQMRLGEWALRLAAIGIVYYAVYMLAGMFVFRPLAGPAFDEFYHDLQMPAWIVPFQIARAMLWVLVALPVIVTTAGRRWQVALAVALSFSLLMTGFLLGPNPIMPDAIRLGHFVEVNVSNFAFGWIVVWLLARDGARSETAT